MKEARMHLMAAVLLCLGSTVVLAMGSKPDTPIESFGPGLELSRIQPRDAKYTWTVSDRTGVLRVEYAPGKDYPALLISAPPQTGTKWDLSPFLYAAFDVRNLSRAEVTANMRVDSGESDGHSNCNYGSVTLKPGKSGVLRADLARRPVFMNGKLDLFGMRGLPVESSDRIDASAVTSIQVFLGRGDEPVVLEMSNLRAGGAYVPKAGDTIDVAKFLPFIDELGQYIHKEWPGKAASVEVMRSRNAAEDAELAANPPPKGRDKWGGWADGPALKATGFFRPEKVDGKWWLVDPDGKLFYSHGIDCVGAWAETAITDRDSWFRGLPARDGEFVKCWWESQSRGMTAERYKDRKVLFFNFGLVNTMRKYGQEWEKAFADVAHRRLKSWGFNTIGNWSSWEVCKERRTPYTVAVHYWSPEIPGVGFKDTFHPDFRKYLRETLSWNKGGSAGDPWCVGYFVDNEVWFPDGVAVAVGALKGGKDLPAKQVFVADLKAKYGEIAKLNAKWGTAWKSWDAMLEGKEAPDEKKAWDDLDAFTARVFDEYFRVCREEVRAVAPDNLYLGSRFAWGGPKHAEVAAAKYCDVVSYNRYTRGVEKMDVKYSADMPILIGEFHFGALDRGMFHGGLVTVGSQDERAAAYRSYVEGALKDPRIVGTHYFQYMDQATTGRNDGENYQIGFIDICGKPYGEIVAASRSIGERMYALRSGK
jgi:hypothetical protein